MAFGPPSEYDAIKHPARGIAYVVLCKEKNYLPTLDGLDLGVSRQTLYDWPSWAAAAVSSAELAVLGAIRDVAYKSRHGACSLTVTEIARLVEVSPKVAVRAITLAIAAGVIEREGSSFVNHHVAYKVG